jgi:hypothetical protein
MFHGCQHGAIIYIQNIDTTSCSTVISCVTLLANPRMPCSVPCYSASRWSDHAGHRLSPYEGYEELNEAVMRQDWEYLYKMKQTHKRWSLRAPRLSDTLLVWALLRGYKTLCQYILQPLHLWENGLNVLFRVSRKRLRMHALHAAVASNSPDIITMLLTAERRHSPPGILDSVMMLSLDKRSCTAMDVAITNNQVTCIVALVTSAYACKNGIMLAALPVLLQCMKHGNLKAVQALGANNGQWRAWFCEDVNKFLVAATDTSTVSLMCLASSDVGRYHLSQQ